MKRLNIRLPLIRNMSGSACRLLLFFVFSLTFHTLYAQDRTAMENKRQKLLEEIRYTERLLSKAKKDAQATLSDITALNHKISLRERLVAGIKTEVRVVEGELRENEDEIRKLKAELEKLRENYASSVYTSYKYQKANQQLLFVLGAENINQAVRRMNYIRKLNGKRQEEAVKIDKASEEIESRITQLEKDREEKKVLLAENELQMRELQQEKSTKNDFIARLKKDETKLKAEIKKKDDEAKKLDREIRLIIERELAAKADKNDKSPKFSQTPEVAARLSKDFAANKGKLPWPVEQGYVSRRFGKHKHPELRNIEEDNTGIDIRTNENAKVRAVFDGMVVSVLTNPIFKHAVIIKHGNYFTVYSKLGKVNVKQGDRVQTKEVIGYVYSSEVAEVHLEVWQGRTNLDPYSWISK